MYRHNIFRGGGVMSYIQELLDQYHPDKYDDLLIDIIKQMKERKEEE